MSVTIKEVAKTAGVSVATVSHVVNKTRYVSPQLEKKVNEAIKSTGYIEKVEKKIKNMKVGKKYEIAIIVPSTIGVVYSKLIHMVSESVVKNGYVPATYFTNDSIELEKNILNRLVVDKRVVGIILSPSCVDYKNYRKLYESNKPVILLSRNVKGKKVDCVTIANEETFYKSTHHLVKNGHEKIGLIISDIESSSSQEQVKGYKSALLSRGVNFIDENILMLSNNLNESEYVRSIKEFILKRKTTAIICGGNQITYMLLKTMGKMGMEWPEDISIIGFGDEEWSELIKPPLTSLRQNVEQMSQEAVKALLQMINTGKRENQEVQIPLNIVMRKSTQMIGRGPFGERAYAPDDIILTEDEKAILRKANYKVGISFHYSGTAWKRLHESGIRQTLENLGISVAAVTDANFDPELQVTQLEGLAMQKLDAIIAIPTDDTNTADIFKKLAKETKLIFWSNVPSGFQTDGYVSCVSVNERENGRRISALMGDYFANEEQVKVGFINHGASFYGTRLRDNMAVQVILENYNNIYVADIKEFHHITEAYEACKKIIEKHPDIKGLYVSWDRPALEVIRALEELGREDIAIFTTDLDQEIADYLVRDKYVKGISTQRPYEQGMAAGLATAKALLGETHFKYIGVPPYLVQRENIIKAWKDIMHEPIAADWNKYLKKIT
ncbi:ribose transport system substrate-binding protein [Aequitasia blattaphilus]|uniref:LacI family DNA-binding transcriptional regulator n=1 Tax=Aequitasia blattaphilus TaxID=2949332 RepID=A0ABT1EBD4_9FIRM|nr:LacI family DNA-binding transcriptional regulator [Aequitasia blattaphilus]MCP1101827.1 LacI family DNA-binding transcriptional regulator [Aequitasia blattaphilus]MCR8614467.1 LacI family DNA-binding transcriptional regulator [Aequitasia blattaphilus]